ncbi:hypothetical protein BLD44_028580 [Mastigocladus laminosus UU774]|nr:hypothetical protein BLD44_028580 [Mastigocladus laminosus UU774]
MKHKYKRHQIETVELDDGTVDVTVTKPTFIGFGGEKLTPTTKTFDNHIQAVQFSKKAIDDGDLDKPLDFRQLF